MRRNKEEAMKIVVSTLIALSVLAGIAAPANALDAKRLFEQMDREHYAVDAKNFWEEQDRIRH
jgi:hypothetical protein